jgi:hypothetical protein
MSHYNTIYNQLIHLILKTSIIVLLYEQIKGKDSLKDIETSF